MRVSSPGMGEDLVVRLGRAQPGALELVGGAPAGGSLPTRQKSGRLPRRSADGELPRTRSGRIIRSPPSRPVQRDGLWHAASCASPGTAQHTLAGTALRCCSACLGAGVTQQAAAHRRRRASAGPGQGPQPSSYQRQCAACAVPSSGADSQQPGRHSSTEGGLRPRTPPAGRTGLLERISPIVPASERPLLILHRPRLPLCWPAG